MPLSTLRHWIAGLIAPEARAGLDGGAGLALGGGASSSLSGARVTDRSALSIAAVWSAVSCYVNTIGALDWYVAERDARGGRRPAPEHPAYDLLRTDPRGGSTSMRLRQAWVGHACTRGNGYLEIERRRGRPVALHLMDPRTTEPRRHDDGSVWYHQAGGHDPLPAADVMHLAMWGWDGLRGYSPVEFGRETLGLAAAQRDYQAGLFQNSATPQGHLEIPGTLKTSDAAELRTNWNKMHKGPRNAGSVGILSGGARWVQTEFSPQDAELILGAKFSVEEVARLWNIPQHKINGLEHATFSNVEELNLDFYQSSLLPWLTAIEQEGDMKLLSRPERASYFVMFDVQSLLRGNIKAQTERDVALFGIGARTVNQLLIAEGKDPVDDPRFDFHFIPVNNLQALETLPAATPPGPRPAPATPAPDPSPAPPSPTTDALRAVLADPIGRMVRRECQAMRKAARRADFPEWAASFYDAHHRAVCEAIGPAFESVSALSGRPLDHVLFSARSASDSKRQVRDLVVSVPPDEMPGAVDRMCDRWERDRVAEWVHDLIPGGSAP